jgi:isopentenyldiphosphate isomerase
VEEYLDVWSFDGQPTGKKCLKQAAHLNGFFHPTVHIWFFTNSPSILLQKRGLSKQTFPGYWDVSVAGHVIAGESILEGALREVKEEIGLCVKQTELTLLGIRKNTNKFDNGITDCEFQHVFLAKLNIEVSDLKIQKTEVDSVRLFSFKELQKCMLKNHPKYTIVPADMSYYQFVIDSIQKRL